MNAGVLVPFLAAALVMISYALYFLYFSGTIEDNKKINLRKRINKNLSIPEKKAKTKNIALLKPSPDTYFQNKLTKIEGMTAWIQRAGLEIKPITFLILCIFVGIGFGFFFFVIFQENFLFSILCAMISITLLPCVFIVFLTSQRKRKFLEDFPVALDIMRRSLRVGYSVDRSIGMVIEELTGPVGLAFKQVVDQLNIGEPLDKALEIVANHVAVNEFRMLAIVMVLQQETGGSLAEALDNFAKIIRSRHQLRKKVKSLTAEVRMTAVLLTIIPFFIFIIISIVNQSYFDPLIYSDNGNILLWIGLLMLITGALIMFGMTYKENY